MDRRPFIRFLAGGLIVPGLFLVACGGKESQPPSPVTETTPQVREPAPLPDKVRIRAPDTSVLAVFRLPQQQISILQGEKPRVFLRRAGRAGIRWVERGKGPAAFVDWEDNGFSVRGADREIVLRLRITDDGWKVAKRPKGRWPFVLRGTGNRFTLVQNEEQLLGTFVLQPARGKVKVYDAGDNLVFKVASAPRNSAFGVLLLPGGKAEEVARYVAMAELLIPRDG